MILIINNLVLFISFLLIIVVVPVSYAEECQAKNICECVYNDGSGYDLRNVLDSKSSYTTANVNDNITIFYNPCMETNSTPSFPNITINDCVKGYMLCLYDAKKNHAIVVGNKNNVNFHHENGQMFMKFSRTNEKNITTVLLECTPNSKSSTLFASHNPDDSNYTLFSKYACIQQVEERTTHGSLYMFFLISLILLFLYLVTGILYNYYFVGARGLELLPNYDFWCRVWNSIKLGYLFVKNGFRVIPTEESYDAI